MRELVTYPGIERTELYNGAMNRTPGLAGGRTVGYLLALIFLPVTVFYVYLFFATRNLPILDDYYSILNFANVYMASSGPVEKLRFFLGSQHNEYKLFLEHSVLALELTLTGHVDFRFLCLVGDLSVLLLGLSLWKMFLPQVALQRRLALFLPVSLLLFQLQYYENLTWATTALVGVPVVAFTVCSIYLLSNGRFAGALATMALAIASSANGFVVPVIGLLQLAPRRNYVRLAVWTGVAALCGWAYAFHYRAHIYAGDTHASLPARLLYLLAFWGSAARYPVRAGAPVLGIVLLVFFLWALRRGHLREHRTMGYCLLFILLTGVAVSNGRASQGFDSSTASRYRIYSDLLLIFAWFVVVAELRLAEAISLRRRPSFLAGVIASALFCAVGLGVGVKGDARRNSLVSTGMRNFQQSGEKISPVYVAPEDPTDRSLLQEDALRILIESEQRGIYRPPVQ